MTDNKVLVDEHSKRIDLNLYYIGVSSIRSTLIHAHWISDSANGPFPTVCGIRVNINWLSYQFVNVLDIVNCKRCQNNLMVDFILHGLADRIVSDRMLKDADLGL